MWEGGGKNKSEGREWRGGEGGGVTLYVFPSKANSQVKSYIVIIINGYIIIRRRIQNGYIILS